LFRVRVLMAGLLIASVSIPGYCQDKNPQSQNSPMPQQGMSGISSAGTFAPVYDAQKRPITAGGTVDSGPVIFEDATKSAGLSSWKHVMGTAEKKYILETSISISSMGQHTTR